jgi:ATP-binding cassette, subfamily D (ALD), peroxisomal long-chain fatty acid import protein
LAGLWAPSGAGAHVTRPTSDLDTLRGRPRPGVFVVPQRAYMVTGSLLEQVIYPQTLGEFYVVHGGNAEEGLKELQAILEAAYLGYLVEREGGWGTVKEWRDVLSGGEKQRVRRMVRRSHSLLILCFVRWHFRACFIIGPS